MVDQGATVGQWLRWLLSDAAPALMAGLFVISAVSALVGYVLATLIWDNWIRLRWRRKLHRPRDQRLERSTRDTSASVTGALPGHILRHPGLAPRARGRSVFATGHHDRKNAVGG